MAAQVHRDVDPTLVVCSGVALRSSWLQVAAGDMFGAPAVGENSKATGARKRKAPGQAPPAASPLHCLPLIKSHNAGCSAGTAQPLQSDDS